MPGCKDKMIRDASLAARAAPETTILFFMHLPFPSESEQQHTHTPPVPKPVYGHCAAQG